MCEIVYRESLSVAIQRAVEGAAEVLIDSEGRFLVRAFVLVVDGGGLFEWILHQICYDLRKVASGLLKLLAALSRGLLRGAGLEGATLCREATCLVQASGKTFHSAADVALCEVVA